MTNIQIPAALLDLFAAFNIADPAQVLILLLSGILVLLLVLIIVIAARGRSVPSPVAGADTPEASLAGSNRPESNLAESNLAGSNRPKSNLVQAAEQLPEGTASARAAQEAGLPAESEQLEDFKIFKRPKGAAKPARPATSVAADDQLSTADHLRLIEKNMVRLRDLYQGGHITRDMYVDETRSLYHQARGLSSIS